DQRAARSALRQGAGRPGVPGLRSRGAEPVADPAGAAGHATVDAGRPGVPVVGSRAAHPGGRASASRHHDRRLGFRPPAGRRAERPGSRASARAAALTMRRIAAALALLLVGYPLSIASPAVVVALGAAALLVCLLGVLAAREILVVGIVLALAEYALALWIA